MTDIFLHDAAFAEGERLILRRAQHKYKSRSRTQVSYTIRGVGSACHLGVLLDVPCLGVAKNLFHIENDIDRNEEHMEQIASLKQSGDTFPLIGSSSGITYGKALKSCEKATKPVYVSPGHKISIDSATELVHRCSKYRVPEPIRQADLNSREYLRVNFKDGS